MALLGVGVYYFTFNLALTFTTASQGALVQSSIPVVTAVMATLWLGERLTAPRLAGIVLALAGVLLIVARAAPDARAQDPGLGNLLMFASVLAWGAYTVLAKRVAGEDIVTVTTCVALMGTTWLIPPALVEAARGTTPVVTVEGWLRIAYLGAFPSALCYLFYGRALRDLEASQVGAFINLVPVLGVASGVAFLGERITPLALVGGALVFAGVWISTRGRAPASASEPA
jgi:drug/metabolite transporter (DMT)-like permease